MSIKKQVLWNEKSNKFIGFCNYGNELQIEGTITLATESQEFMLVSLRGRWKLPVGYVLLNKTSAVSQAEFIKSVLSHAHNAGIVIWSVTCDGAYTNFATLKLLGCELGDSYENIKYSFDHFVDGRKVYFVPNACHMLKLARNA